MSDSPEIVEQESNDQELTCQGCGAVFVFTGREQRFYLEMGFVTPRYCPTCRKTRKRDQKKAADWKDTYEVTCDSCGVDTTVPFKPVNNRPVYCRKCLDEVNRNGSLNGSDKVRMASMTGGTDENGNGDIKGIGVTAIEDSERPYADLDEAVERLCVDLFGASA